MSKKAHGQCLSNIPTVFDLSYDAVTAQKLYSLFETSARQRNLTRMELGARNDPRLPEGGQPHRLGPVEFRILERSDPHELRHHPRRQA